MLKGSPILPLGCRGHQVYIEDILLFRMVENTNVKLHLICPEELSNAAELRSPAFFSEVKIRAGRRTKECTMSPDVLLGECERTIRGSPPSSGQESPSGTEA